MPRSDRRIALVSGVTLFLSRFAKGSQAAMGPSGGASARRCGKYRLRTLAGGGQ